MEHLLNRDCPIRAGQLAGMDTREARDEEARGRTVCILDDCTLYPVCACLPMVAEIIESVHGIVRAREETR